MPEWFHDWFNEDYLKLYPHRDAAEAEEQIEFVLKATGLTGGRVLDLGCGAGRHAIALAQRGFDVVGVDISKILLDEAKQQAEGLPIQWICSDMRTLPTMKPFDLILSMFTSFGYFATDAENEQFFKIASENIKSHGFVFLDFLDPQHVLATLVPTEQLEIDGESVRITREIHNNLIIKKIHFPDRTYQEQVKLYKKAEVIEMAAKYGLKLSRFWHGYKSQNSNRQLFMFKA